MDLGAFCDSMSAKCQQKFLRGINKNNLVILVCDKYIEFCRFIKENNI